ncbi:hypothetical protein [Phytohabitans suffuscus]|uniref:Uncharacterized protein n=1 Tax=Phytohabitans suffuscus TaxID=624315 RepID=A0A6F8YCN5_9ACTN|nr:hypothetical protein [Phytohabitans suffuscus]BCB83738.1 hypothetical protein Psuf_010510 [Phytohabitans suffuscus]
MGFSVLRVEHEGMIGGANGLTDYAARTVAVRANMDPAAQGHRLAHDPYVSGWAGSVKDKEPR